MPLQLRDLAVTVRFRRPAVVRFGAVILMLATLVDLSKTAGVYGGGWLSSRQRETNVLKEYCEWERFQPNCSHGEVVVMRTAKYGRMRLGRCVEAGLGFLGCSTDVLRLADAKCSGRQNCDVSIPDKDFDATRPCYKELKVYLEANYICVRVAEAERGCTVQLSLTGSTGLASYVVSSVGPPSGTAGGSVVRCGTASHPWVVEAESGQRINISMIDFGTAAAAGDVGRTGTSMDDPLTQQLDTVGSPESRGEPDVDQEAELPCPSVYGFLVELGDGQRPAKKNVTLCGGGRRREREVYQTEGHVVQMSTSTVSDDEQTPDSSSTVRYFLVRFEAVGCADLRPPADSWLKRSGDDLVVGCHSTSQTWHLKCIGRKWSGVIGNCTSNVANARKEALVNAYDFTLPHLLTIATVVVISLTMSCIIVSIGVLCFRRFAKQERARKQQYAAIAADKLYNDVTSGIDDSSTTPYGKTIGSGTMSSMPDYPPHIWQLPLPPPGGDTFPSARCHQLLQQCSVSVATKGESDYGVGSMDSVNSRYFVLDHNQGNASVIGCHNNQ